MSKGTRYFIWSNRHSQWWGPERSGYTLHIGKAGQYDRHEAADIVLSGLPCGNVAVDTFFEDRLPETAQGIEKYLKDMGRT